MKNYDEIINNFLKNQNNTPLESQRNVFSKEEYERLLDEVTLILKQNKDKSIDELRDILYKKSGLERKIRNFFYDKKKAPGAVIGFGTDNYEERLVIGNQEEIATDNMGNPIYSPKEMNVDTIFDLASCTKLFTAVAILQLAGNGELSISDKITKYLPQFHHLGNHTIFDLLTFQPYYTERRIETANSFEEAEEILFNAKAYTPSELMGRDRYNDFSSMILKYIVEEVTGIPFATYIEKYILKPGEMESTYVKVPDEEKDNTASCNYSYIVLKDGTLDCKCFSRKGISSDIKAVKLGQPEGKLPGHAGIFSTCEDMTKFGKGLVDGRILHPALTNEMAKNRTNSVVYSGGVSYIPTYGFLCNSKNPNRLFSDMHQGLSGNSFSQSGWSGTQITVDPLNKIHLTYLSNRVHNRIVSMPSNLRMTLRRDGLGAQYYGSAYIDSSQYAFERREITNACLELAIKEKMLEELVKCDKKDVKIRKLKPTR